jgi:hypothetical protein
VETIILALLLLVLGFVLVQTGLVRVSSGLLPLTAGPAGTSDQIVRQTESIAAAISRATPGSQVVVEPGEYREQLLLRDNIRVVSRVPRAAIIRLPAAAAEGEAAVVAEGLSAAEFAGFRIVGDAATPLGVGILVRKSALSILDVEVTGAAGVAVDIAEGSGGALVGSEIRDNPGVALAIRAGAAPRIAHNWFARNGASEHAITPLMLEPNAAPTFQRNVFQGTTAEAFAVALGEHARRALVRDNWFLAEPAAPAPAAGRRRPGR